MNDKKYFGMAALFDVERSKADRKLDQAEPEKLQDSSMWTPTSEEWTPTLTPTSDKWTPTLTPTPADFSQEVDAHKPNIFAEVDAHIDEVDAHKPAQRSDRHTPDKIRVSLRYRRDLHRKIMEFCARHGLPLQDLHELAITEYMQKVDAHIDEVGVHKNSKWTPHDDLMIIYKTHDDIIMLYRKLTNRKWTASDDRAATRFNDTDRRLIEIGMIHTVLNAKGKKIHSFAYFIPEIDLVTNLHIDNSNLDVYLKARRAMLEKWQQKQQQREEKKQEKAK